MKEEGKIEGKKREVEEGERDVRESKMDEERRLEGAISREGEGIGGGGGEVEEGGHQHNLENIEAKGRCEGRGKGR